MSVTKRIFRHLWLDADDAFRLLGKDALDRLDRRIHDSELGHSGEICLCVEASLPLASLWRHFRNRHPIEALVRERALELFSSMRVWDTEDNNGVLIYLQLAEQRIEIVADRGIADALDMQRIDSSLAQSCAAFAGGRHEEGLNIAIEAVDAALRARFPDPDRSISANRGNQLPDRPVLR